MSERANQLISDILRRVHEAIVENDVTYEEYQAVKHGSSTSARPASGRCSATCTSSTWWRRTRSATAPGRRGRSSGRSTCPTRLCSRRRTSCRAAPKREGDRTVVTGRVTDTDGNPLAGANLDVWQADASGALLRLHARPAGGQSPRPGVDPR